MSSDFTEGHMHSRKLPIFHLYSFLRKTHLNNRVEDSVNMNQKEKFQDECDIFQICNFSYGLGIKVMIGKFSSYFPKDQQLHLYGEMSGPQEIYRWF